MFLQCDRYIIVRRRVVGRPQMVDQPAILAIQLTNWPSHSSTGVDRSTSHPVDQIYRAVLSIEMEHIIIYTPCVKVGPAPPAMCRYALSSQRVTSQFSKTCRLYLYRRRLIYNKYHNLHYTYYSINNIIPFSSNEVRLVHSTYTHNQGQGYDGY